MGNLLFKILLQGTNSKKFLITALAYNLSNKRVPDDFIRVYGLYKRCTEYLVNKSGEKSNHCSYHGLLKIRINSSFIFPIVSLHLSRRISFNSINPISMAYFFIISFNNQVLPLYDGLPIVMQQYFFLRKTLFISTNAICIS